MRVLSEIASFSMIGKFLLAAFPSGQRDEPVAGRLPRSLHA